MSGDGAYPLLGQVGAPRCWTTVHPFLRDAALVGVALASVSGTPSAFAEDFDQLEARLGEHPTLEAMRPPVH